MNIRDALGVCPRNPIDFAEGSVLRNVYSNKVYILTQHYKKGMCDLYCPDLRSHENWNSCNNQHFIPADYVSLGVRSLL